MDLLQRLIEAASTTPTECPVAEDPPKGSIPLGTLPDHLKGVVGLVMKLHAEGKSGMANDVLTIVTRSIVAQEHVVKLKAKRREAGKPPLNGFGVAANWQAYAMEARPPRLAGFELVVLGSDGNFGFDISDLLRRRR